MTAADRLIAVVVGLTGLLFAVAAMVREVVLAAQPATDWSASTLWGRVSAEPSAATTVAAAVAALLAAALLILAVRQFGSGRRGPALVVFAGERGWARLDVAALERALCHRLEARFPGLETRSLELTKRPGGWRARLEAEVPARDLDALRERAHELLAADLERTGGLRFEALDIVAVRLTQPPAGAG